MGVLLLQVVAQINDCAGQFRGGRVLLSNELQHDFRDSLRIRDALILHGLDLLLELPARPGQHDGGKPEHALRCESGDENVRHSD